MQNDIIDQFEIDTIVKDTWDELQAFFLVP